MWGGFFVRSGPQQAHGKQGINYAAKKNTPLSSHLLFPNLGHNILKKILRGFIYGRRSLYACFIGFSC